MGGGPLEPPTAMQHQQDGTTTGHLEGGALPKERQVQGHYGSGMPARRQWTSLQPPPCIPHSAAVMVIVIAFHTEDPDRVGDALKIFLFLDLPPSAGLEAPVMTRKWDDILGEGTLNFFSGTSPMMGKQKVDPIAGWDEAAS